jgi:hypothetical protein
VNFGTAQVRLTGGGADVVLLATDRGVALGDGMLVLPPRSAAVIGAAVR